MGDVLHVVHPNRVSFDLAEAPRSVLAKPRLESIWDLRRKAAPL